MRTSMQRVDAHVYTLTHFHTKLYTVAHTVMLPHSHTVTHTHTHTRTHTHLGKKAGARVEALPVAAHEDINSP